MSLNKQFEWHEPKLLPERLATDEEKLKTSLAYRDREATESTVDEPGTAEHRPRHGLVYDAPLGLKF